MTFVVSSAGHTVGLSSNIAHLKANFAETRQFIKMADYKNGGFEFSSETCCFEPFVPCVVLEFFPLVNAFSNKPVS